MGSKDNRWDLASVRHGRKTPAFELHGWRIPGAEQDEEEYSQDMSHEDLQSLADKLKGYGQAADPLTPDR